MKAYAVKGTTDEVTECELCGRVELKGTVILVPLNADGNTDGEPNYFGTSCAAKAAGWTTGEVTRRVTVAKKSARKDAAAAIRVAAMKARQEETAAYARWLKETYPVGSPVKEFGVAALWAQFRAARTEEQPAAPVATEPAEELEPIAADITAIACPALVPGKNRHLMHVHCVDCNAHLMARMTPDTVEGWYRYGNFSQDEFEAYMYAWATSATRHTAGGWAVDPTDPKVLEIVAAIRRHAGLLAPTVLAA